MQHERSELVPIGVSVAILLAICCPVGVGAQERPLSECLRSAGASDEEAFLVFDGELRSALAVDDPTYLTLLSHYPLRVYNNDGVINVTDARTLYSMSDTVFPEAVRSRVLDTDLADLICTNGGIGYGSGDLWVNFRRDGDRERFQIRQINLPRVSEERSASVECVCRTTAFRSVVDRNVDGTLRFRVWSRPRPIGQTPDLELFSGREDIEGSGVCGHRVFSFESDDATYSVSELGCTAEFPPDDAVGVYSTRVGGTETAFMWCF